ncbi:MAG: hypothetical protein HDS68_00615 [Bacteroidales bacterium]|nr:hypothetical protein [Bacteroidales bacterium]
MHVVGIDIGTSSICGVIHDISSDFIRSVTIRNDTAVISENSDEKMQNPERILDIVIVILNDLIGEKDDIVSIGITGQMHGILYTDREGDAVSPLYTWQDGRGNRMMDNGESYACYLSRFTSEPLATGYGLVTHFYNLKNHLVPAGACRLCTIMDYVVMKLTGLKHPVTEYSNAAPLGFFDKRELRFNYEELLSVGIDGTFLPEAVTASLPLGFYNGAAVYPAIGDNQAAFLGSVVNLSEAVHITVGTSSQISIYTPEYIAIPQFDTRPLPGGGYILVGAELCGGYALTLLKNFFAEAVKAITGETVDDDTVYTAMMRMDIRHEVPLKVDTHFDGTRADPTRRGSISDISTFNFIPGNLVDAFLTGLSDALHAYYLHLPLSLSETKTHIVASGNGMRKNHRLREAFAKGFRLPVVMSEAVEEAAFGAAVYAGKCFVTVRNDNL